jgi:hypothetical protein
MSRNFVICYRQTPQVDPIVRQSETYQALQELLEDQTNQLTAEQSLELARSLVHSSFHEAINRNRCGTLTSESLLIATKAIDLLTQSLLVTPATRTPTPNPASLAYVPRLPERPPARGCTTLIQPRAKRARTGGKSTARSASAERETPFLKGKPGRVQP